MGRPSTAKQRLLEAACREFSRVGAQAAGVDELCRLAKINKGSFYHFFPSKSQLILACLDLSWETLREAVFEPAFAPDRPPLERIAAFFDRIVDLQERQREQVGVYSGCVYCTLGNEIGFLDTAIQNSVASFMDRNLAYLTAAYAEANENSALSQAPEKLAEITYTLLLGSMIEVKIRQNIGPLHRAKEVIIRLIKN